MLIALTNHASKGVVEVRVSSVSLLWLRYPAGLNDPLLRNTEDTRNEMFPPRLTEPP